MNVFLSWFVCSHCWLVLDLGALTLFGENASATRISAVQLKKANGKDFRSRFYIYFLFMYENKNYQRFNKLWFKKQ